MDAYAVYGKNGEPIHSDKLLHPGYIILNELKARNIKNKSSFALECKIYPTHFSDILKGKRGINAEIALKLQDALGIDAEFWMRVQAYYDLMLARKKRDKQKAA